MSLERTLYHARWLLDGTGTIYDGGALIVDAEGRIERVGPAAQFDDTENVKRIDLGNAAIIPGLINVHAHPELAAFRGLLDDLPFHEWIPTLMRCKRGSQLTLDDYVVCAQWTCVESLRAGITTMGATEDSGAAVTALANAGMRGVVYLETFGPAPDQAEQSLADLRAKVQRYADHASDRIKLGVSPHAPYTVSDGLFALVAAYAKAESLPVATHAAEAETEDLLVREGMGAFAAGLRSRGIDTSPRARSTIELLKKTGLLECAPLLIHAVRIDEDDIHEIGAAGAKIAHCPVANARLGHGIAPIVEARAHGVLVGIGTDSVASNNRLDILEEARVAQIAQRARLQSAAALPAAELLGMCTIDNARILGLDARTGSLEPGKSADFCVVALDGANAVPAPEPLNTIFHAARGSDVALTVVEGRILFDGTHVTTLDESGLREQLRDVAERLRCARSEV